MTNNEKLYLRSLVRDYNMTVNCARVKAFQTKETYEEMYKRMDYEEKLILELQCIIVQIKPPDIRDFWNDKKDSLSSTHSFIQTLYV